MFQLLLGLPYFLPALIRQVTSWWETPSSDTALYDWSVTWLSTMEEHMLT